MKEPEWILEEVIYALHSEQLAEHGGKDGVRDVGLLKSALDAPKNIFYYLQTKSIFKLAAAYGYRISNNQPFFDGNKRTGYVALRLFLLINGYDIQATQMDRFNIFLEISNNHKTEDELANWIEQHSIAI